MPGMETGEHIKYLDRDGRSLADAAAGAGTDAEAAQPPRLAGPRPAAAHRQDPPLGDGIRDGRTHDTSGTRRGAGSRRWRADPGGPEGHDLLGCRAERGAPHRDARRTFMPAPTPLAFSARRQAHETGIHRVDAESALGTPPAPMGAAFAVDGIDAAQRAFTPVAAARSGPAYRVCCVYGRR